MFYNINFDKDSRQMFERIGIDLDIFLREAGIPPRAVNDNKFQLTSDQYKRLIEAMDEYMNDRFIVEISKVDSVASFNPEFFAGLCAENGLECIRRISKYKKIVAPIQMSLVEDNESVSISYVFNDGTPVPRMMFVHAQISILSIIRKGTGIEALKPKKISGSFEYPIEAVEYFNRTPSIISEGNAIVFSKEDLMRPFITKNNRMWDYLENELNHRLREMEVDQSFSAIVRRTLLELLPSGISDAEKISFELGVSKRTLQRRLKEENTSFNEQLNHIRELMVRNYLKMDMSLDEIAFLVNYSDAKSLSRAFKVWTGMSVTDYRSELSN
ncbi:helix-turn-helix domain-containing protein [Vallitalea pronyensis]|uniref:Helix-turn-helix domain-containing protein n=1 Tax=Vallitalea pronyensis TaxID=1348613 RepID=A0A8J8SJE8_9FIRM|nr:AraC family transcriptional regulator [Vallitalea pronyensis]QUI25407.1 helix-turn-helix domain-containing protein [Vallitalea pronyensis]